VESAVSLDRRQAGGDPGFMTETTAKPATARLTDPAVSALIRRQHGVLTAAQAAAKGLPHETLRRRVLRGIWQRLLPGIYALQCGPPSTLQWSIAALLYAGEGSMLTGPAALAAYRLPAPRPLILNAPAGPAQVPKAAQVPRLDVLVPHRVRRQNVAGIRIVRTHHLPTPIEAGPLRFAPLAKAVIDTCLALLEDRHAVGADLLVAAALADGRVGLAELDDELGRAPRRNAAALRAYLTRQRASARSAASHRLFAALGSAGTPGPMFDVAVYEGDRRVAQATALWPTRGVAAAVDAPEHEIKTLSKLGFAVVQIAPHRVAQDLPGVLRQVGTVLQERPEATLPAGVSLLARATSAPAAPPAASRRPKQRRPGTQPQRVLTADSPARTGCAKVLPRGGTGQT
jgi:hypothetical protein